MSELTQEQYEELPDYAKDAFAQEGDKYIPAKDAKLKGTLNEMDGKYKSAEKRAQELEGKLSEYEKTQQAAIEKAKADALEEARKTGDVTAFEQQMEDLKKRHGETLAERDARIESMSTNIKTEKKNAIVSDLSAEMAVGGGETAFKLLISSRIDIDPETGKKTYLNADGSASSLDDAGFKAEIKKDPAFSRLIKADVTTSGGGNLNGSGNGGGAPVTGKANGTKAERAQYFAKKFNL